MAAPSNGAGVPTFRVLGLGDLTGIGGLASLGAGTGLSTGSGLLSVTYGTSAGTAAQGNDSRITGALQTSAIGSGLTLSGGALSANVTTVAGRTGAVTLSAGDISGLAPSATTDTTNAANIGSGVLSSGRLSGVDASGMNVTATGGNTAITEANRAAQSLSVLDFGAVFDGNSHPLSARFATLAAAQAVYPFVTSLTQQSDSVGVQAAINYCGTLAHGATIRVPAGSGEFSEGVANPYSFCNIVAPTNSNELIYSVGNTATAYATRFQNYSGFTGTLYRISPVESASSSSGLTGSGIQGVVLDCNKVAGCTAFVQKSTSFFTTDVGVNEPLEYRATTNAATAAGSNVLSFASTSAYPGLELGAAITGTNILRGTYVTAFNGTSITISSNVLGSASFTGSFGATATGTGSGTNLTLSSVVGTIHPGSAATATITGTGIPANTYIVSQTSGTTGGAGVYVTNQATTASAASVTVSSNVVDISAVASGVVDIGMALNGTGLTAGTVITGRGLPTISNGIITPVVEGIGAWQTNNTQYVASEALATTGGVASGASIGIAGEGARFDTAATLTSNTLSFGYISVQALNSTGHAPLMRLNGSGPPTGGGSCCGNIALNTIHRYVGYTQYADILVINSSDHNYFEWFNGFYINPSPFADYGDCLISSGTNSSTSADGPAYSNRFNYTSCKEPIIIRGTETYTTASSNTQFAWLDYNNATPLPTLGTGASAYSASDQGIALTADGSLIGVQAQLPDNTATRGAARGQHAVDLQSVRDTAGEVAYGTYSTIAGGYANSAPGYSSGVTGGHQTQSFGTYSTAGGQYAYSYGYGWDCHASNNAGNNLIAEGCRANLNLVSNSSSAWRLTGDGNAATTGTNSSNNCLNIIASSQATMDIQLSAYDRSNGSSWFSWHEPHAVLRMGSGGVSTTTYTASGSATSLGPMSASVSATADTTNGCLNLSFTPPSGNSDYISTTATIRFTWTQ